MEYTEVLALAACGPKLVAFLSQPGTCYWCDRCRTRRFRHGLRRASERYEQGWHCRHCGHPIDIALA